jgi:hypothetical protein
VRAGEADDGAERVAGPGEVGGRLDGDPVAGFECGDLFGGGPVVRVHVLHPSPRSVPVSLRAAYGTSDRVASTKVVFDGLRDERASDVEAATA